MKKLTLLLCTLAGFLTPAGAQEAPPSAPGDSELAQPGTDAHPQHPAALLEAQRRLFRERLEKDPELRDRLPQLRERFERELQGAPGHEGLRQRLEEHREGQASRRPGAFGGRFGGLDPEQLQGLRRRAPLTPGANGARGANGSAPQGHRPGLPTFQRHGARPAPGRHGQAGEIQGERRPGRVLQGAHPEGARPNGQRPRPGGIAPQGFGGPRPGVQGPGGNHRNFSGGQSGRFGTRGFGGRPGMDGRRGSSGGRRPGGQGMMGSRRGGVRR